MTKLAHKKLGKKNNSKSDEEMLDLLQWETLKYFEKEVNAKTGLIKDKTAKDSPASIASSGLGLCSYITSVEHGYMKRSVAVNKTLTILNFFYKSRQGTGPEDTGYKGFYYHFLDMKTGKRAWKCELSTIDSAILLAGVLTSQAYFNRKSKSETEIRRIADELYKRADWQWAANGKDSITHGWKPESGFLKARWDKAYSEAHIVYILALGSPTFPVKPEVYKKWISTFTVEKQYGLKYIYAGPLFIHQMSQIWIDFKNIKDELNKKLDFTYFENSRRATIIQQQYAIENKPGFEHYSKNCWGVTASDGPGPATRKVDGVNRKFFGYTARGVPYGPDDGTISPWAVAAAIPFSPKIVISTLHHAIEKLDLKKYHEYGFDASFNPTFPQKDEHPMGWISPYQFGLNQGPVILMIENYRSGLIWNLMKTCPYVIEGLRKAGFKGRWLK